MKIWRLIAGALLAAVACAPSYAQQTKSQLNTYNNAVIVSNGVGAITANVLNPLLGAIINASCTIADPTNCPLTVLSGATANLPLIGAASGGGVTQGTLSGNTTLFPTVDSAPVTGNCAVFDSFGGLTNISCSPSGSGTVGAGLSGQLASYPSSGTAVAGVTTGTGVLTAISNAVLAPSGLVALDANRRLFNTQGSSDWLATYAYGESSAGVFLGNVNDDGITGAARTSTETAGPPEIAVGGIFWGFQDGGSFPSNDTWGLYTECRQFPEATIGTLGHCAGQEIDITNLKSTTVQLLPYNQFAAGATYGLHLGSGGGCTSGTPCYDPTTGLTNLIARQASAALVLSSNSATYGSGIVFGCGSIGNTDCSGHGEGDALSMYPGIGFSWYAPGNSQLFVISVADSTTRAGGSFNWSNNGFQMTGEATAPTTGSHDYLCIDSAGFIYASATTCP